MGAHPKGGNELVDHRQHRLPEVAGQVSGTEFEYGGADLGDRRIELVHGLVHPAGHLGHVGETSRTLQRHSDGEDALNHPIMQIPGNAVAVVEH